MSYQEVDDDPSIHRLAGSSENEKGGLVIKKKSVPDGTGKHEFKVPVAPPKTSLLGLDRLAAAKRKAAEEENKLKKSRVSSYNDEDEDEEVEAPKSERQQRNDKSKDR